MEDFNQLFDDELFNIDEVEEKTLKLKDGERRMVSVLFADIKGFTSMSEKLDHEEVQSIIDKLMKIFSHSVDVYGGYVDKYTGDQIMALFGAKKASEVDTQRAINSGIDMLSKLEKFNVILNNSPKYADLNIKLSIRIGINTGMVTTGAIGKQREGDYTVYGDAVNLAARMESNAPVNSIMIPEDTKNLVENDFTFNDQGNIEVKGKSDPISVFVVMSRKDVEVDYDTPFLGRDNELQELNKIYNDSKSKIANPDSIINVVGLNADAGTGKSRLIYEFLKDNADIQSDGDYSIGFASNISSKPYFIFTSLIKDIFGISEIDDLTATKDKLEKGVHNLKENYDKDLLDEALPFIGFLIGVKYDDSRLQDRAEFKNHMHISVKSIFEATCRFANNKNKPYLFILDDLHWIDKMSLDMLCYIFNTLNLSSKRNNNSLSYPMILTTYRPEFTFPNDLKNYINLNQINLKPLPREFSRELIDRLLANIDVEQDKKIELLDKSKGNPFFIEEWVNLLKESHTYAESLDESRGVHNIYKIPNSLNSLILARVDSLESKLKMLLQKATIIGEDFFLQILSKLEEKLGLVNEIQTPINELEKENFIKHFINQLDHYKFKHILTRDVAYSTILKSNKKVLHAAVAEIIEENFADKIDVFYYDLAIHYDISEKYDKAIKFLSIAGEKNFTISDFIHSKQCYERIVSIIKENEPYSTYLNELSSQNISEQGKPIIQYFLNSKMNLGKIFLNIGQWNDGIEILKSCIPHLDSTDNQTKYDIYFTLGQIFNLKREANTSKEYFTKCMDITKEMKNKLNYGYIVGELSDLEFDCGNVDNAIKGFKKQLEIAEELKIDKLFQASYLNLGKYYFQSGDLDTAIRFYKKLYDLSSKLDAKQQILQALGNISLIHNIRGEYDKSIEIFKDVIAISEDIHDLRNQAMTYGNQGIIYKNLKDFDKALNNYNRQLEISQEIGDKWMQSNALDGIGLVYQKLFEFDKSIEYSDKALLLNNEINDINGASNVLINSAGTCIMLGDLDLGLDKLNKALSNVEKLNNDRSRHLIYIELSKILYFKKNLLDGYDMLFKCVKYFNGIKDSKYLFESIFILSKYFKYDNKFDDLEELINSNDLDYAEYKHFYEIEKEIIISYKESKISLKLERLLKDKQIDLSIVAYTYFILGKIFNDKEMQSISKKTYSKLYSNTPIYEYKYYHDMIK